MLIAGFMPESFVDWRGKIVATVFTHGCNFRCPFCHNYSLVIESPREILSGESVIGRIREMRKWIDGVCITGGEPTVQKDIVEFVKILSSIVPVKLDTNGSRPDVLSELLSYVDYVAMDIKAPPERYSELAGVNVDIEAIDESIRMIKRESRDYEFRTTAVPTLGVGDFVKIGEWIGGARRYVIQQYSTLGGTLNREYSKLKPHESNILREICRRIEPIVEECIIANSL